MNRFLGTPGGEVSFCLLCGTLAPAVGECPSRPPKGHDFAVHQAGIYTCSDCGQQPGNATSWCPAGKVHRWFRSTDEIR